MRMQIGSRKRQVVPLHFPLFSLILSLLIFSTPLQRVFAISPRGESSNQPERNHVPLKNEAVFSNTLATFQKEKETIRSSFVERRSFETARNERAATFAMRSAAFFKRGDLRNAGEEARRILVLDVGNQQARELLRQVLERQCRRSRVKDFPSEDSEISFRGGGDRKAKQIEILIVRAERLNHMALYDHAVDQLEKVFMFDPLNRRASRKIDRIRDRFLQMAKSELKKESIRLEKIQEPYDEEASLWFAEQLIRERRFAEAKTVLNQLLIPEWGGREGRNSLEPVYEKEAL